jgi:hypothetical protein
MTHSIPRVKTIFFNGDWNKPSPLGWILLYGVTRVIELFVLADQWWMPSVSVIAQTVIALLVLPKAIGELRELAINEAPNWEYKFWTDFSMRLGKNTMQCYVRLTIAFAFLVLTQMLLKNLGVHWTAVLRDVGLQVVVTLFYWSRE